jgi:hypothetical protein
MSRAHPRYPLQLDNAFMDLSARWEVPPFELEMLTIALLALSPLGTECKEHDLEAIEHMVQKMALKHHTLPTFTVAVQAALKVN